MLLDNCGEFSHLSSMAPPQVRFIHLEQNSFILIKIVVIDDLVVYKLYNKETD